MQFAKAKKQRENNKRRVLSKWLASFAVTATVVVAAVIANQEPVTATFESVKAIDNTIVYRIEVQDPGKRIAEDTLLLEIKSGYEKYQIPIETGKILGTKSVFGASELYELSISADLGFGRDTLSSYSIHLADEFGGAISDVHLDPNTDLESQPETLTYYVDTVFNDPKGTIESAILEYAPIIEGEMPQLNRYDLQYMSIPISLESNASTTTISDIPNYNYEIALRFVVYVAGQVEPLVFDELTFQTPYRFSASMYVGDAGSDYATFFVYTQLVEGVDVDLWIDLFQESALVSTTEVDISPLGSQSDGLSITVENLTSETLYSAVLMGRYIDPMTQLEKIVEGIPVEFATTPLYSWQIVTFYNSETSFEVAIEVNDPSFIITSLYYEMYYDDGMTYIGYGYGNLTSDTQDSIRTYTAVISKPAAEHYTLAITLSKSYNSSYYSEIIYTLNV